MSHGDGNAPGLGLREDVLMDLHHKVTPRHKLGHKAGVAGGLEAGEEREQEGVPGTAHGLQDPLLTVQAAGKGAGRRETDTLRLGPASHVTALAPRLSGRPRTGFCVLKHKGLLGLLSYQYPTSGPERVGRGVSCQKAQSSQLQPPETGARSRAGVPTWSSGWFLAPYSRFQLTHPRRQC